MGKLWELDSYLLEEKLIPNTTIIEYDLQSASTSIAAEFGLLSDEMIARFNKLPKGDRNRAIGLYKRDHKEYGDMEKAGFMQARKMFFEQNDLAVSRVIAIKRDAIFVEGEVFCTRLTDHLNFRKKNEYTSYLNLNSLEIFYRKNFGLDVKKMNREVYEEYHKEYFGSFIESVLRGLEFMRRKDLLRYIRNFYDKYRWLQLDSEYYREFSPRSEFAYKDGLRYSLCTDIAQVDMSYNMQCILYILNLLL